MRQLYQKRKDLAMRQRQIVDLCEAEDREMSSEEQQEWDAIDVDWDANEQAITRYEETQARREKLAEREGMLLEDRQRSLPQREESSRESSEGQSLMAAFFDNMAEGTMDRQAALKKALQDVGGRRHAEQRKALQNFLKFPQQPSSYAALQVDNQGGGGALVLPEQFVANLIIGLDEAVAIRSVSTVIPVNNAESLGAPVLDNDPADADWTVELATGSEDTTMSTSKRRLTPHPVAKLLKVSKTLLRTSAIPADSLVRERLGFKMAITQEKAFLTGTGDGQPLGVFTASADGISTSRDVSTGNTTTAITGDGLIEAKYGLASQYHNVPDLRWIFHRTAVKNIRKLKTGDGQYIWQPGLASDRPNTILDTPYFVSENAPSTFTTGLYVGIIGAWRFYWIAEALSMNISVAQELYMATNQNGYFMRAELDAMPVLEEAFSRVTLA